MTTQRASSRQTMSTDLLLSQKRISRRTALAQLVGLALAGGSIAQLVSSCGSASPDSAPSAHSPTPSSHSLGTVLYTYHGHSDGVTSVAWSPDGMRIASGSHDDTVQVWDPTTGGNTLTYRGHSTSVLAVAWSPDGKRIASGNNDQTVQVWDAANGGHIYTYRGHQSPTTSVAWSPDGKRIASAGDDAQVWDAAGGGHVYTYRGHLGSVIAVSWSPDGKRIASGSDDHTVQLWQAT